MSLSTQLPTFETLLLQRADEHVTIVRLNRPDGLALEIEAYNRLVPTEGRREGVLAFNEKRKPNFRGR